MSILCRVSCKIISRPLICQKLATLQDVARLLLMVPIEPWRNSTPFFGAEAFCTTKIYDFSIMPHSGLKLNSMAFELFQFKLELRNTSPQYIFSNCQELDVPNPTEVFQHNLPLLQHTLQCFSANYNMQLLEKHYSIPLLIIICCYKII